MCPAITSLLDNLDVNCSLPYLSSFLQCCYSALTLAAKSSNKTIDLSKPSKPRKFVPPIELKQAQAYKSQCHKTLLKLRRDADATSESIETATKAFASARSNLRRILRHLQQNAAFLQEQQVYSICSSNPGESFKFLSHLNANQSASLHELKAGDQVFRDNDVAFGFFQNVSKLKTLEPELASVPIANHLNSSMSLSYSFPEQESPYQSYHIMMLNNFSMP